MRNANSHRLFSRLVGGNAADSGTAADLCEDTVISLTAMGSARVR